MIRIAVLAFALVAVSTAGSQAGVVASLADDFTVASNPNGAWSYGYSNTLTGPFEFSPLAVTDLSGTPIDGWFTNTIFDGNPSVTYNETAAEVALGTVRWEPGQIILHPGPQGQFSTARWIAPVAGIYQISTSFLGQDVVGTTTDVHVLLNGVSLFDGTVNGFGPTTLISFADVQTLAANDVLEVKVGYLNGTFVNDSTGVTFDIQAIPEPASIVLASTALVFGVGLRLVRRRRGK